MYEDLPWNFEAFRRFITYEALQQASATLVLYDGEPLFTKPALMDDFSRRLNLKTGLEWLPKRRVSEGVLFNVEGDVFRNKARVFTSLYIIDPECLQNNSPLHVTDFGKALAYGYIPQREFYAQVFMRYEYPHPAYDENWNAWTKAGIRIKPLAFFLKILYELFCIDGEGIVTTTELAEFAHSNPIMKKAKKISEAIHEHRRGGKKIKRTRTDKIDRKINDILAFMCISGFTYFDGLNVGMNLMDVQREEGTHFWEARGGQNRLDEIGNYLKGMGA